MSNFHPRRGQREIMEYQGGRLGVSAVPGSGKTTTIYACLRELVNKSGGERNLVTLEDPMETVVPATAIHLRVRSSVSSGP